MNLSVLASTSNRTVDPKVVAMDSVEIPSAAGGVNNELMSQIDTLISSKFASLEDRMTTAQKSIADSQLSKIKEDILSNDSYVLKRKSCEDQFKFNVKVSSKLRDADVSVKNGDAGAACSSISEEPEKGEDPGSASVVANRATGNSNVCLEMVLQSPQIR